MSLISYMIEWLNIFEHFLLFVNIIILGKMRWSGVQSLLFLLQIMYVVMNMIYISIPDPKGWKTINQFTDNL